MATAAGPSTASDAATSLHLAADPRQEYLERFSDDAPFINAGLEQVPTDWLNQRLVVLGERVDEDDSFRTLRELDQ